MEESKVECFSAIKTAQNSKAESGIERKNMKMWNFLLSVQLRYFTATKI